MLPAIAVKHGWQPTWLPYSLALMKAHGKIRITIYILGFAGAEGNGQREALRDGAAVGFPGHLRISVGTREVNERLLKLLEE